MEWVIVLDIVLIHKLLHEYQDHDRVQTLISLIHFSSTTDVNEAIDEADVVALINVVKSTPNIDLKYFI